MIEKVLKPVKIQVFNSIVATHPQFKEDSVLYEEIQKVVGGSIKNAKALAATHCNMISYYAILRADSKYKESYSKFFEFMLDNNFANTKGRIIVEKEEIAEKLNIETSLNKFYEYEDVLDPIRVDSSKFLQFKIFANTTGDHFLGGYISGGKIYISDTSYRGIAVPAEEHINLKNFQWVMEI